MKRYLFWAVMLISLFLAPGALAVEGSMKLLAVKETANNTYEGSAADLRLEIEQGTGRVFLDTYPLIKLDTQISTRFAKQVACDYLDISCGSHDFIYTITADTSIIGGPSAGAATAVLTVALLSNIPIDGDTTVTGTINSGGIIGPVGGLKEKIDAAAQAKLKRVLIPKGERYLKQDNGTIDLAEYGSRYGIHIIEVANIGEALYEFSGTRIQEPEGRLTIDKSYADTMKAIATDLCTRSSKLKRSIGRTNETKEMQDAEKLQEKADKALAADQYYTAASYCFGANVNYNYLALLAQNLTKAQAQDSIAQLKNEVADKMAAISERDIKTITDLESYMVVKERLLEADESLQGILDSNSSRTISSQLAYATERLASADAWSQFFANNGKEFTINEALIEKSCQEKLGEAEERFQYLALFFPSNLGTAGKEIDFARNYMENREYALCLFRANKAKAAVDVVLSVLGVEETNVPDILAEKLEAARKNIMRQENKDVFPVLGYSYYEYATNLKEDDQFSALLYSEYALELSSLDLYFEQKQAASFAQEIDAEPIAIFIIGAFVGASAVFLAMRRRKEKGVVISVHRRHK